MSTDCDFYINTFDEFLNTCIDENEKAFWKMRSILNLMKLTQANDNRDFCENGLRMIMVLYKSYVIYPFEKDEDCQKPPLNNHNEFLSILKSEFT